jgi:hypothetical protein
MTIQAETKLDADAAFSNKGSKAVVFHRRFGQAHQQYFTPRWLCQACADVAERLFDVTIVQDQQEMSVLTQPPFPDNSGLWL